MRKNLDKILFGLCGLCAFVLGMKQLREPDVWWQLLSGKWMLENGAITRTDMFSYTMAGRPWINVKWLYEILIATLEKGLGAEAVLLLQAIINVIIVWLLVKTLAAFAKHQQKSNTAFSTAITLLIFLAIVEYRMAGRPEMISHLMCTLYMYILWRNPGMDWKKVWWLVPLQCLWANMHEGYPVGIVIIGAATAGALFSYLITKEKQALQQVIRAAALLAACVLIILCNPNGIVLWKQPFEIYRQVWANKYTTELYSYKDAQYWTLQAKWHIGMLVAVAIYWIAQIIQAIKRKEVRTFFTPMTVTYLLLLPLFAYLSLTANRNIPFSQIVMFPSVVIMLIWIVQIAGLDKKGIYQTIAKQATVTGIVLAVFFYATIVSNKYYNYTNSPNKYGIHTAMLHNPTGAAAFIKQHNIQGPAFADYFISSYLLWDLYPQFKSYIDLRDLDVFPEKFFDSYFSLYQQPDKFKELDAKYNFNYVVVSTSQLQALQMDLYYGDGYNLVYVDPVSAIFLKHNQVNLRLNNDFNLQKMFTWPVPVEDPSWAEVLTKLFNPATNHDEEDESQQYIFAARFYLMIKNYSAAVKMLLPQLPSYDGDANAYIAMGNTYLQYAQVLSNPAERNHKLDSAGIFLERAKEIEPANVSLLSALAKYNISRGDYESAADYLSQYLKKQKNEDYMYYLYGFCNRMQMKGTGDKEFAEKTISAMKTALRLNPQNGKANLYMAESYLTLGDNEAAKKNLNIAIASGNKWQPDEQQVLNSTQQALAH